MKARFAALVAAPLIAAGLASAAQAQPRIQPPGQQPQQPSQASPSPGGQAGNLISRTTAEASAPLLQQAPGVTNVSVVTIEGKRHLRAEAHGMPFVVFHQQCDANGCPSITFIAPFGKQAGITLEWMNSWNFDKRFTKLSRDADGDIYFSMDAHFFGGVSPDYIRQSAAVFAVMVKAVMEYTPGR
jgi:hypothetical protein